MSDRKVVEKSFGGCVVVVHGRINRSKGIFPRQCGRLECISSSESRMMEVPFPQQFYLQQAPPRHARSTSQSPHQNFEFGHCVAHSNVGIEETNLFRQRPTHRRPTRTRRRSKYPIFHYFVGIIFSLTLHQKVYGTLLYSTLVIFISQCVSLPWLFLLRYSSHPHPRSQDFLLHQQ